MAMQNVFVGRQPIYRKDLSLYAYELLFRGTADSKQARFVDNDAATSQVLYNTFVEIGLENIIGEHRAFVNLTERFLLGEYPLPCDNKRLVLEILEHVKVTEVLVDAVKDLKKDGYKIALDDFIYRPELKPLVPIADIIKIDLMALNEQQLRRYVKILRDKSHAKLLAEKVETQAEYELCQELGFEFYQGYYFSKPNTITGTHIPASKLSTLQLIARIQDDNVGMAELEDIIAMDAGLSYKLLKVVNSAAFSLNRQVDSIKSALIILGITHVKNWASMLSLSKIEDKPHELLITALVRANMSYEIARQIQVDNPDSYFTAGMLSILDALIDKSMEEIVPHLPLSSELQLALLQRKGRMGEVLECITHYESGNWNKVQDYSNRLGLDSINLAYLNAVKTTEDVAMTISHAA